MEKDAEIKAIQDEQETDAQMRARIESPAQWREIEIEKMAMVRDSMLKDETYVEPPTEEEDLKTEEETNADDSDTKDVDDKDEDDKDEEFETLNVKGEEVKVSKSKVYETGKRSLQKDMAADKKLEEAGKILDDAKFEAQRIIDEAKLLLAQKPIDQDQHPQNTKRPDAEAIRAKTRELIETIQYGDSDEAAEALAKILELGVQTDGGNQRPNLSDVDVSTTVEKVLDKREVTDKFYSPPDQGGYSDLLDDPDLFQMVNNKVNEKLKAGAPNKWATYQKAGDEVRDWVKKISGGDKESDDSNKDLSTSKDDLQERREKKGQMAEPIKAAHTKQTFDKPVKAETAADIITEIRQSRGQPIY